MGDWPEFEVKDGNGTKSTWSREVNDVKDDSLYIEGKTVEIDYVIQWHRKKSWDGGSETKCVIQIRVER